MYTPDLASLNSTYGSNKGSLCYFTFFPREWLAADIIIDPVTRTVDTAISLIAGKSQLTAKCLDESMEFQEKPGESTSGSFFSQQLTGVINKDEFEKSIQLDTLRYHELVVVYYDSNGKKKIIGNIQKGMKFSFASFVEKELSGKTYYEITLTHATEQASPFYTL